MLTTFRIEHIPPLALQKIRESLVFTIKLGDTEEFSNIYYLNSLTYFYIWNLCYVL